MLAQHAVATTAERSPLCMCVSDAPNHENMWLHLDEQRVNPLTVAKENTETTFAKLKSRKDLKFSPTFEIKCEKCKWRRPGCELSS